MKIGFIGAGQMASALAVGIAGSSFDVEIFASDPSEAAVTSLRTALAAADTELVAVANNQEVVEQVEFTFIAVKPQFVSLALQDVKAAGNSEQVFVSVVAGTKIKKLANLLGSSKIVRAMPNTPCLLGAGATAIAHSQSVAVKQRDIVKSMFEQIGVVVEVPERLIDAVTGLSGSGPAYVYTFVEALIDAGVLAGLPRDIARILALQTVGGSVEMLKRTDTHPAVLRDRVTSPGGTTIHGMEKLEQHGFRESIMAAVQAAAQRSVQLADGGE